MFLKMGQYASGKLLSFSIRMHQKLLSGKAAPWELTALPQISQLDVFGKGRDKARGRDEKGKQKGEVWGKQ